MLQTMTTSKPFKFKKFSIQQSDSAMKVGTDGVLLGAWCDINNPERILDIGTGTGLISLMLAQRFPESQIVGVEVEPQACIEARANFEASDWSDRLSVIELPIQEYETKEMYDLIVSNPPFFENSDHTKETARSLARSTQSLAFTELIFSVVNLLKEDGLFSVILPTNEGEGFRKHAEIQGLHCTQHCDVHPTPEKSSKRLLMTFSKRKAKMQSTDMIIEDGGRHQYSEEYKNLTQDFYLNM